MRKLQSFDQFINYCDKKQLSLTPLRKAVLQILASNKKPLTAYEILAKLKKTHAHAKPMTVYRILEFFQTHHLAHRIESNHRYLLCIEPEHGHISQALVCTLCDTIIEIDDKILAKALTKTSRKFSFSLSHDLIELKGQCQHCI